MRMEGEKVKSFCSERCFAQYRRAAFKKTRVCDWCRKAVGKEVESLMTVQDKDTQLQFCKYVYHTCFKKRTKNGKKILKVLIERILSSAFSVNNAWPNSRWSCFAGRLVLSSPFTPS